MGIPMNAVIRPGPLLLLLALLASVAEAQGIERRRVIAPATGMKATIISPDSIDPRDGVELILYALPNGNSTAETMGDAPSDSAGWRYDIQHIAAQTRALRARGVPQAIVAYLEADSKSWPAWRLTRGYDLANRDIVSIVDSIVSAIGRPS